MIIVAGDTMNCIWYGISRMQMCSTTYLDRWCL